MSGTELMTYLFIGEKKGKLCLLKVSDILKSLCQIP